MAIISVRNGDSGMLWDAKGREIPRCVKANLQTGDCWIVAYDSCGLLISQADGHTVVCRQRYPAPLRWLPRR